MLQEFRGARGACPFVQTSHLTMYHRGVKSKETDGEAEIKPHSLETREASELYKENVYMPDNAEG